ncbi:MAG TPA: VWA domain-containing protein, partial [Thermoanaerobaculia bacterium]|nr:VWA domain-containing protein [Thermoanaerobaculia bacterium]
IEERDLTILVAVDVSGSMGFGSIDWRKCDIAAELASVFAFSAVQNSDRIGLLLFSDTIRRYVPPRRGRAHAQVIVRHAVEAAMRGCSGDADLGQAAAFLERVSAKKAVVIVVSDFLDMDFERTLRRLHRRHDVIAVGVSDPREERFPERGLVRLVDAETGEVRLVDLAKSDVARRAMQRQQQLVRRFRSAGIDHLDVSTAVPYDRPLLRFFRERVIRNR